MGKGATQLELFRASNLRDVPSFRDDIDVMSVPLFSVSKSTRTDPIEYEWEDRHGRRLYVRVESGPHGIATMWDNDILIYLRTVINDALQHGQPVSNRIQFTVHDCLRSIGRGTGGDAYEAFHAALRRLSSTRVHTNLSFGDVVQDHNTGWIQEFSFIRGRGKNLNMMACCEVIITDWFYNGVLSSGRMLAVDPVYFEIESGIGRKLWMIARKHVGQQSFGWTISLENLHARTGAQMPLRRFKFELNKLIAKGLPGFEVELVEELALVGGKTRKAKQPKVVFKASRS